MSSTSPGRFRPLKFILVPGTTFRGATRQVLSVSSVHTMPAVFRIGLISAP